jgi:hypothetical protein
MPEVAGEFIDRLVCTEMRPPGFIRGVTLPLYDAAREVQGAPLSYLAANALAGRVKSGDYIFLLTGAGSRPWRPNGETDGPLGAVSLGRALALGLGAHPVYISHHDYLLPIIAASQAAGVSVLSREMVEYNYWLSALALPFPLGKGPHAEQAAQQLLDDYKPTAVISMEKLGPNRKGVVHGISGRLRAEANEPFTDLIVEGARRGNLLTIGIGDGGNELGYGKIFETVRRVHPYGAVCRCPCGDGIACQVETDILVHGATSNWASHGVAACLAVLLKNPQLLHESAVEEKMLQACVDAGAEGGPGYRQPWVDNIPSPVHVALVTMLHGIIDRAIAPVATVDRPW